MNSNRWFVWKGEGIKNSDSWICYLESRSYPYVEDKPGSRSEHENLHKVYNRPSEKLWNILSPLSYDEWLMNIWYKNFYFLKIDFLAFLLIW